MTTPPVGRVSDRQWGDLAKTLLGSLCRSLGVHEPAARLYYRCRSLLFFRQFLRRDSLCFDVGANIGNYTDTFRRLASHVVAVEPDTRSLGRLTARFKSDRRVTIVAAALGGECGHGQLFVCDKLTLNSLSLQWVLAVRASGRFTQHQWIAREPVKVTTLDALIDAYGTPAFCKIDVEGFESEVLRGLSRAIPALSFEFTPEIITNAFACIDHLQDLGSYEYNYAMLNEVSFRLPKWIDESAMKTILRSLPKNGPTGDVYARLPTNLTQR